MGRDVFLFSVLNINMQFSIMILLLRLLDFCHKSWGVKKNKTKERTAIVVQKNQQVSWTMLVALTSAILQSSSSYSYKPVAILQQTIFCHPRQVPVPMYPYSQPLCPTIFCLKNLHMRSVLRSPVSVCLVPLDSNPRCVYSSTRFQNISIDSRHTLHLQQLDHSENVHVVSGEEGTKTLTRKCCKLRVKYLAPRERMFLFLGRLGWRAGSGSCAASKMAGGHVTRSASRRSSAGQ